MTAGEVIARALICDWQTADEDSREYADEMADAILAALRGAGFAVVPREASKAMLTAGYDASELGRFGLGPVYRAMVAAAETRTGGE